MPDTKAEAPGGRSWAVAYVATLLGMLALQMPSLGFSPLLPAIQEGFRMNFTQVGLFTGVYGLVSIVLSVPAGLMARRYGEKAILSTGLLVVAVGLLTLSQAPGFAMGLTARVIWLAGYRLSFVCVMIAIALTTPPRLKGSTMGILGAVGALASVIGAPFGTQIGSVFGWRGGITAFAGITLAGLLVFAIFYKGRKDGAAVPNPHGGSRSFTSERKAHREPIVWALAASLGLLNIGAFTITFFVPAVVTGVFKLGAGDAAVMISTAYGLAIFMNLLVGYLADRFNRWSVMMALAALLIAAGLALFSRDLMVFRVGVAVLVALGHSATNQVYALVGSALRGKETGPAMGIVSLGAGVYAYLGPQMIGLLRDRTGGFEAGFWLLVIAASLGLVAMTAMKRYTDHRSAAASS